MNKVVALFLITMIFATSFLAQGEPIFSDKLSHITSTGDTVSITQRIDSFSSESIAHPCHFGHLGGCAPIASSQIRLTTDINKSKFFIIKSQGYSAPFLDGLDRPPIS